MHTKKSDLNDHNFKGFFNEEEIRLNSYTFKRESLKIKN